MPVSTSYGDPRDERRHGEGEDEGSGPRDLLRGWPERGIHGPFFKSQSIRFRASWKNRQHEAAADVGRQVPLELTAERNRKLARIFCSSPRNTSGPVDSRRCPVLDAGWCSAVARVR